jgi:hypothetical protein
LPEADFDALGITGTPSEKARSSIILAARRGSLTLTGKPHLVFMSGRGGSRTRSLGGAVKIAPELVTHDKLNFNASVLAYQPQRAGSAAARRKPGYLTSLVEIRQLAVPFHELQALESAKAMEIRPGRKDKIDRRKALAKALVVFNAEGLPPSATDFARAIQVEWGPGHPSLSWLREHLEQVYREREFRELLKDR